MGRLLDLFISKYNYTDFHELNLDCLISDMMNLVKEMDEFVSLNTIKYADPIQWDITRQYKKNTVVIDANTGTAYISVDPVPVGVELTNTDYWTVIFSLDINTTNRNITLRDDGSNILSTFPSNAGDWLLWNGTLYKVTQAIGISQAYVPGYNIERFTVELFVREYITEINTLIGSLNDLTTTDKTSVVDAINELVDNIATVVAACSTNTEHIGDLDDLTTTNKTDLVAAINEVNQTGGGALNKIGDLDDLTTSDKSNVVAAINEVNEEVGTIIAHDKIFNVLDYGAIGDGVADDTDAIKDAIADLEINGGVLYFPQGRYKISDTLNITHVGSCVRGDTQQGTYILQSVDKTALHFGNGSTPTISYRVEHIGIVNTAATVTSATYGIHYDYAVNSTIDDVVVGEFYVGIFLTHTGNTFIHDVGVVANRLNAIGFNVGDQSVSIELKNCYVGFSGDSVDSGIGFYAARGDIADLSIDYMDIGNGAYGLFFNGSDSPNDYPPADIRLRNIIVDGSRIASIHIQDINARGNVVIDGGWLNPHITATSHCIEISNSNNIFISNVIFQQLAELVAPTLIAITLYQTTSVNVEHCEFLNVAQALSGTTTDKTSFVNNHIKLYTGMTSTTALYLATAFASIITNNNFYGTFTNGVVLDALGDNTIITNNIFTGITTAITDPHTNTVNDNNLV